MSELEQLNETGTGNIRIFLKKSIKQLNALKTFAQLTRAGKGRRNVNS
jgi:hypothetical protein